MLRLSRIHVLWLRLQPGGLVCRKQLWNDMIRAIIYAGEMKSVTPLPLYNVEDLWLSSVCCG